MFIDLKWQTISLIIVRACVIKSYNVAIDVQINPTHCFHWIRWRFFPLFKPVHLKEVPSLVTNWTFYMRKGRIFKIFSKLGHNFIFRITHVPFFPFQPSPAAIDLFKSRPPTRTHLFNLLGGRQCWSDHFQCQKGKSKFEGHLQNIITPPLLNPSLL